jgi:hypothetical protein
VNRFQTYLVEEFAEDYQEGHLSRREALKLIGVTGSLVMATSILAGCTPTRETAGVPTQRSPPPLQPSLNAGSGDPGILLRRETAARKQPVLPVRRSRQPNQFPGNTLQFTWPGRPGRAFPIARLP